jgi:hypothetical protein
VKTLILIASVLGVVGSVSSANAMGCVSSSYGTACTGPLGTVAVTRDGAAIIGRNGDIHAYRRGAGFYAYHNGSACYWQNLQHICP